MGTRRVIMFVVHSIERSHRMICKYDVNEFVNISKSLTKSMSTTTNFVDLDLNDYEFIKDIGKGAYCQVSLQRNKKTGELAAVKTYDLARLGQDYTMDFCAEFSMIGTLNYPSIIKLYGCHFGENAVFYALEYMENGSLDDLLTEMNLGIPHPDFGPTQRMIIIAGVACALRYMHHYAIEHGEVMHRDVKAGNVLLDKNYRPKLADFGFTKVIMEGIPNTPQRGSWPWMAPEVMRGDPYYNTKADVYSFGMFLYEVVTDMMPFVCCNTSKEVIERVTVKKERPFLPEPELPIYRIIRQCWMEDPKQRPDMKDICQMLLTETMALPGCDLVEYMQYVLSLPGDPALDTGKKKSSG